MSLDIVRSHLLDGVPHGFFGRRGGVSTGTVAGLNCGMGSGDDPAAVETNRRLAADAILPGAPIASVYQFHSPAAVIVTEAVPYDERPRADALVTDRPGLALGILTADCAPILFADAEAGVVGAAHAGWKGALGGVTEAAIAAMRTLGAMPERITAVIGPCIGPDSYEVGPEFRDRFLTEDPDSAGFFHIPGRRGAAAFRPAGLCRRAPAPCRPAAGRGHRARHAGGRRPVLQLSPHHPAQGAGLRPPDLGDRADGLIRMPHLITLFLFIIVALLGGCVFMMM